MKLNCSEAFLVCVAKPLTECTDYANESCTANKLAVCLGLQ